MRLNSSISAQAASMMLLFGLALIVLLTDQATKQIILATIPLGESWSPVDRLERILRITHTTNTGAAFGMFASAGDLFVVIAIVVSVGIVVYHHHLPAGNYLLRAGLGLQLGGAMGNLLDRVQYGYVIDFVHIGFWPIFNVADTSILCGVILLMYGLWRSEKDGMPNSSSSTEADHQLH